MGLEADVLFAAHAGAACATRQETAIVLDIGFPNNGMCLPVSLITLSGSIESSE